MTKNTFETLFHLDVNEHVEQKKTGKATLSYLSWAWAWAEVKKRYPEASYTIHKFENNLPYVYDEHTGYMVFTEVTIAGVTHEMWLPVMDGANNAMKSQPYTYEVKEYKNYKPTGNMIEKKVEAATMFDINKTIMRCLVKNLAMFGLGLYLYSGEDLPQPEPVKTASEEEIKLIKDTLKEYADITGNGDEAGVGKLSAWALGQLKVENYSDIPQTKIKPFMQQMKAMITKAKKQQEADKPKEESDKKQESLFEGSTTKPKG